MCLETIVTLYSKATAQQKRDIGNAVESVLSGKTKNAIARIIRREEASSYLGVSVKRIDQLSSQGILKRIYAPGTTKAIGISEASLRALTEGPEAEGQTEYSYSYSHSIKGNRK